MQISRQFLPPPHHNLSPISNKKISRKKISLSISITLHNHALFYAHATKKFQSRNFFSASFQKIQHLLYPQKIFRIIQLRYGLRFILFKIHTAPAVFLHRVSIA